MKKFLFLLCTLWAALLQAQEETRTLPTVIEVIPSASERFDVSKLELTLDGVGMPENGFTWDAATNTFRGEVTYTYDSQNYISLRMPDGSISFEGPLQVLVDFSHPEVTSVYTKADFSPYHYVSFASASPSEYGVTLQDLYVKGGEVAGESAGPNVRTPMMPDGMYKRANEYAYTVAGETTEGIAVAFDGGTVTVDDRDVAVTVGKPLAEMSLATFTIEDAEGRPAEGADIYLHPTDADFYTDADGKLQVYLNPGSYIYSLYIGDDYINMWDVEEAFAFVASGKETSVDFSYKDNGWKKVVFSAEMENPSSARLELNCIGVEYDEYYGNADQPYFEVYMPEGEFKYRFEVDGYGFSWLPAEGIVNTAETREVKLSFDRADYAAVDFELVNVPDDAGNLSVVVYRDNEDVAECGVAYPGSPAKPDEEITEGGGGTRSLEPLECGTHLLPGTYVYVVEDASEWNNRYDYYAIDTLVVGEEDRRITVDFDRLSVTEVTLAAQNVPEVLSNYDLYCDIRYKQTLSLMDLNVSANYSGNPLVVRLPEGDYSFEWGIEPSYYYDAPVAFAYQEKQDVSGASMTVGPDFAEMGIAKVQASAIEGQTVDYLTVLQDGRQFADGDFSSDGEAYLVALPGTYTLVAEASDYEGFNIHLSEKDVTLVAGQTVDVNLTADQALEGVLFEVDVENMAGQEVGNAKITVNGMVYETDAYGYVTIFNIQDDEVTLRVEAPGYLPYEKVFRLHKVLELAGGAYMRIVLRADDNPSGVESVESGALTVERTVVDRQIVICNETDKTWNVALVGLGGEMLERVEAGQGTTVIPVDGLRKGLYLLTMNDGVTRKTVKVIKK